MQSILPDSNGLSIEIGEHKMKAQKYPATKSTFFQPNERIVTIAAFAQQYNQRVYEYFANLLKLILGVGLLLLFDNLFEP